MLASSLGLTPPMANRAGHSDETAPSASATSSTSTIRPVCGPTAFRRYAPARCDHPPPSSVSLVRRPRQSPPRSPRPPRSPASPRCPRPPSDTKRPRPRASCPPPLPLGPDEPGKTVILLHRIAVILSHFEIAELPFVDYPLLIDGPNVLRPVSTPSFAHHSAAKPGLQQVGGVPPAPRQRTVADRLVRTRRRSGTQAGGGRTGLVVRAGTVRRHRFHARQLIPTHSADSQQPGSPLGLLRLCGRFIAAVPAPRPPNATPVATPSLLFPRRLA